MDGETLIITEMVLTAVLCLGFGFYQLWSLKRDKRRAEAAKAEQADTSKPGDQQAREGPVG